MNKIEAYNLIKNRSLFQRVPIKFHEALIQTSKVIEVEENEKIQVENDLYILVTGKVQIKKKNSHLLIETIQSGRSLELGQFLNEESYHHHWITIEKSILLQINKNDFFHVMKHLPEVRKYLKVMTQYPQVYKLKRDLKFSSIEKESIMQLFIHGKKTKSLEFQKSDFFRILVVLEGELRSYINIEDEKVFVTSFLVSDYLVLKDTNHILEASEDFSAIIFQNDFFEREAEYEMASQLLDRLDERSKQKEQEYLAQKQLDEEDWDEDEEEEDEDDFTVQDFKLTTEQLKTQHQKKFYWMQQHDQMDCGAACLAMISRYYGKKINIATWRSLVHITKEGASMLSLKKAAEQVGFDCIGVMTGYKALMGLQVPCIALMEYHFVVVYQVTPEFIWIADPGTQLKKITKEEFAKEFSSNCLLLRPNHKLKLFPNSKNTFLKYFELFKDSKIQIFEILLVSLVIFILSLTNPLFLQFVFDNVLVTQDEKYLRFIALVFLGLTLLTSFSNKIRGNLLASLTSKLSTKFTSLFLMHTLKLPFSYFEVRNVGDITTRLSELDKIRDFFSTKFVLTFVNLFSLFIYLFVLYLYAPILILVFLPFIPIFLVFLRYLMKKAILNLNNTFKAAGKMQSLTFEQIEGIETLKSLGALVATRWRWEESIVNLFKNRVEFEHISVLLNAVSKFFQEFVAFTLFITGIYLYFEGDLSLGQVIAINALGGSIVAPLIQLMQEWDEFNKIAVSIEKVDEIFTSPTESIDFLKEYKQNDKKLQGDIQFKNIFFQYGNEQSPMVLKGINLQINAGETIAFVGSSGSGKTTLAYMVNRLYNPTKGHVLVDGVDSAEIPLEDLRESMAMINQDNNIFSGTIIDNITLGDSKPDFNRVIEAAKLADAHDFIIGKKAGYYHQLGESGTGVSGGQKQRLNIARAFYKNPNILIMDEATSALDSKSEAHIMKNIKKRGDKTTLIIAHRLNTIIHADRIFVFHKGQLIEQGSHKELILAQKKYFQMFKKQLEMS